MTTTPGMSILPQAQAERVCAVVVTWNRKDLLRECLQAILAQTHHLDRVLVIDNFSDDGTPDLVREEFPQVKLVRLERNCGGAGGFHEGIKRGAIGYDWLWLLDDDTISNADALEQLFSARERFPTHCRPDLLASKVVWTDGSVHSMNNPWIDQRDPEKRFIAAESGTFPVRTATFVSLLLRAEFVARYGLPLADYFVWGDDVEYTGRILRDNFGVAVATSIVVHKTTRKHSSSDPSPRFYYHVRNVIWIMTRSRAFSMRENLTHFTQLLVAIRAFVTCAGGKGLSIIFRGILDGILTSPRS